MSDLYPCPYDKACSCPLTEPCLGCETFGEYHYNMNKDYKYESFKAFSDARLIIRENEYEKDKVLLMAVAFQAAREITKEREDE